MIPLATVSGIATTTPEMIDWFARNVPVSVITTKSIQEEPNPGNREPVITEPEPGSFGNAVGLRNPGVTAASAEFRALASRRADWPDGIRLNISIAANDPTGFARLVSELDAFADILELNLSCPHAHGGYGSDIGRDPVLTAECVAAAVMATGKTGRTVPIYAKLTPNTDRIGEIARIAVEAGAAGIVAINTAGPSQYRDPSSGEIVLTNPAPSRAIERGQEEEYRGRGGRSGRWIRERALECVREIRATVGTEIPIIGMGGVESPEDARAMVRAGASIVGIGSVLARVDQREWPAFFAATTAIGETPVAARSPTVVLRDDAGMRHRPCRVQARRELGEGFFELELAEPLPFHAGQTVFLWVPPVGEKPFSPAVAEPATFLIRRRGPVTRALGELTPGDTVYLRGPYGRGVGESDLIPAPGGGPVGGGPAEGGTGSGVAAAGRALVLAAGTGLAPVPALLGVLAAAGYEAELWWGVRSVAVVTPLDGAVTERGVTVKRVNDNGEEGRVLRLFAEEGAPAPDLVVAIGPEPFMARAAEIARSRGVPPERVLLSLEKTMLCGVGLCGLCGIDGRLTCQYGTFVCVGRSHEMC